MNRFAFCLLVVFFATTNIYSQYQRSYALVNANNNLLTSKVIDQPWNPVDFVGSPYYDHQFKLGQVFYQDSLIIKDVLLRYNVHKESIEIKAAQDDKVESIQGKPGISFNYGNEHFSLMFNPITGMKQYFRKVYEGPVYTVYLKPIKVFKEGQKAVTHLTRDILPSYITKDTYYFQKGKQFEEVRTSRSGVRSIFSDFRDEVKEFIKKNDLRFKDESFERELTQVIQYYESLKANASGEKGSVVKNP